MYVFRNVRVNCSANPSWVTWWWKQEIQLCYVHRWFQGDMKNNSEIHKPLDPQNIWLKCWQPVTHFASFNGREDEEEIPWRGLCPQALPQPFRAFSVSNARDIPWCCGCRFFLHGYNLAHSAQPAWAQGVQIQITNCSSCGRDVTPSAFSSNIWLWQDTALSKTKAVIYFGGKKTHFNMQACCTQDANSSVPKNLKCLAEPSWEGIIHNLMCSYNILNLFLSYFPLRFVILCTFN